MELRHLRYFVAVAEELNFHRAAERLHLAQPSLGRQVRALEEQVGERLIERDRQHVALTEAGRVLLEKARELLADAETAVQAAREAGRGARGALRIGSVGTLTAPFLPSSLAALRRQFPQLEIEILELTMDEQVTALLTGTIQVEFLVRVPGAPVASRLATRSVLACPVAVVLPAGHPLAVRQPCHSNRWRERSSSTCKKVREPGTGSGCGRFAGSSEDLLPGFANRRWPTRTRCSGWSRQAKDSPFSPSVSSAASIQGRLGRQATAACKTAIRVGCGLEPRKSVAGSEQLPISPPQRNPGRTVSDTETNSALGSGCGADRLTGPVQSSGSRPTVAEIDS